jgi:hypothetical protein
MELERNVKEEEGNVVGLNSTIEENIVTIQILQTQLSLKDQSLLVATKSIKKVKEVY